MNKLKVLGIALATLTVAGCSTGLSSFSLWGERSAPVIMDNTRLSQVLYEDSAGKGFSESVLQDWKNGLKSQDTFAFIQVVEDGLNEGVKEKSIKVDGRESIFLYRATFNKEYTNRSKKVCKDFVFYKEAGSLEKIKVKQIVEGSACIMPVNDEKRWFIVR